MPVPFATHDMLLTAIERSAGRHADRPAVTDAAGGLSYRELWRDVSSCAEVLEEVSARGESVGFVLANGAPFIAALLAAAKTCRTAVLFPASLTQEEFRAYARIASTRLVLTDRGGLPFLQACGARRRGRLLAGRLHLVQLPAPGQPAPASCEGGTQAHDADFIVQFTSGQDEPSKAVARSQAAVWAEVASIVDVLPMSPDDSSLVVTRITHSYGLIGGTLAPLSQGGQVLLPHASSGADLLGVLERSAPTVLFATPPVLRDYGATECGTITLGIDGASRNGRVGRPLPHIDLAIVDADGRVLPPGTRGEVVVASVAVAKRYLPVPPELGTADAWSARDDVRGAGGRQAATLADGRFFTGDTGLLAPGGELILMGRGGSMIRIGADEVDPARIEAAIASVAGVEDVAVVPAGMGSTAGVKAIVVAAGASSDDIAAHCRTVLPADLVPGAFEFRDSIPRTPSGKLLRRALNPLPARRPAGDQVPDA
jgi:long-chain acyl-CoA synthetase